MIKAIIKQENKKQEESFKFPCLVTSELGYIYLVDVDGNMTYFPDGKTYPNSWSKALGKYELYKGTITISNK